MPARRGRCAGIPGSLLRGRACEHPVMARILLVEPFYGGSHKVFADGLARNSRHEFTFLTLPDGEWRRRMRRGAQELAAASRAIDGDFDLILATDMLDLPVFLALTRPRFARTPILLYMHENQFTYPRLKGTTFNSWFGQQNYLSACAADAVAFNSEFHRQDFLGALRSLAGQPNNWLVADAIPEIEAKSSVLPVGVDLAWMDAYRSEPDRSLPPLITWNHRWEFDKCPELFARALARLAEAGVPFRVAVAGEPGPNPAPELVNLPALLGERVVHHGFLASKADYARLLWESDIVISTTRHEFFGVAMVEALYCGCFPIAPERYNYPFLVPAELHPTTLWKTESELMTLLANAMGERPEANASVRASAARFDWPAVAPGWDAAIDAIISG